MNKEFRIAAPAKINLHLHILGTRPDGFHDLLSIFHGVALWDDIHFKLRSAGEGHLLEGEFGCSPEENLILRSTQRILRELGRKDAFHITVEKRIPSGAGLGGGSSDAAAVLKGLNRFYGGPLSPETLARLGAELGSDVPFFLGASTAALVSGRGEKIAPLPPLEGVWLVLVTPELHISTPEAFRWFDQEGGEREPADEPGLRALYAGLGEERWRFFNSFAPSLFRRFPLLEEIYQEIEGGGGLYTGISGSGSSLFGVFKDLPSADRAFFSLKGRFQKVWKIKLLARWKTPY